MYSKFLTKKQLQRKPTLCYRQHFIYFLFLKVIVASEKYKESNFSELNRLKHEQQFSKQL